MGAELTEIGDGKKEQAGSTATGDGVPSHIRGSHTSPVRGKYILDAPFRELDISVGDHSTASTQHDTERRAGLVLLLSPPSLQSRNPASRS